MTNSTAEPDKIPITGSRRGPNTDDEPNNNFASASAIAYAPAGHLQLIGGFDIGDPCDIWKIPIDNGTPIYSGDKINGAVNATKLIIYLKDINVTDTGSFMTMYDADEHELGKSLIASGLNYADFTIFGQGWPFIYIKIQPNNIGSTGFYLFEVLNTTEDNMIFDDNDRFTTAEEINITAGLELIDWLHYRYDNADFYKFDAQINEKIKIELHSLDASPTADFDLYLFNDQNPYAWVDVQATIDPGPGLIEEIEYFSDAPQTFYIRVVVKLNGSYIGESGRYKLAIFSNLPPYWNQSYPETIIMEEDSEPYYIHLESAFYDANPTDQLTYRIWDASGLGAWEELPTSVEMENVTIELLLNQTDSKPLVKIIPKADKFGTETIKLNVTDISADFFILKDLNLIILPVNDLPIINNTKHWENGKYVNPSSDGSKVTGFEGTLFETRVTAYDPVDPWDTIKFFDNTKLFDINTDTGKISFLASYHDFGIHKVNITVRDNGTYPNEVTRTFKFEITRDPVTDFPIVSLASPSNNSIQYNLIPEFKWLLINEELVGKQITYELYLSTDMDKVQTRNKTVLIATLNNTNFYTPTTELEDKTRYYWTVIPNDGLHMGECESGIFTFTTNTEVPKPKVELREPYDNQMLSTTSVTLTWDLIYTGTESVKYDLFFGVSMDELVDPNRIPYKDAFSETSIKIIDLLTKKYYYWQVIPFTDTLRAGSNESEIWRFYVAENIPKVVLLAPENRTVQFENWMTLSWEVEHTDPTEVSCELYYTTSLSVEFQKIDVGQNRSYTFYNLEEETYYWKVVPYNRESLRGIESELREFSIFNHPILPKTKLISPVNMTVYSLVVILKWELILDENVDISTVWYDVYLDNTTNDPQQMKQVKTKHRQNDYLLLLPQEPKKVYYWYIVPHADTEFSHLKGYCSSGVVYFQFDYETPRYNISLNFDNATFKIKKGSTGIVYFKITNNGNRETTVNISLISYAGENLNFTLKERSVHLDLGGHKQIALNILAFPKASEQGYTIIITAFCSEYPSANAKDTLIVEVGHTIEDTLKPKSEDGDDFGYILAITAAIIIIIVILIVLFLFMKKKKTRAKKFDKIEPSPATDRITGPGAVKITQDKPLVPKATPVKATPPVAAPVTAKPVTEKPVKPVAISAQPSKPATPTPPKESLKPTKVTPSPTPVKPTPPADQKN